MKCLRFSLTYCDSSLFDIVHDYRCFSEILYVANYQANKTFSQCHHGNKMGIQLTTNLTRIKEKKLLRTPNCCI